MAVYHRRAGKDYMCFNGLVPLMLARPIVVVYIFKTAASGRRILWDARDIEGKRVLAAIPNEAIQEMNNQSQQIILKNGSVFRIIGSDKYNETVVGNNIHFAIFSEYSVQPQGPACYAYLSPILLASRGTCIFLSTPRGHNWYYDLWFKNKDNSAWFVELKTIHDTGVISWDDVQKDIDDGKISLDRAKQEYLCDWNQGQDGSYYSAILEQMYDNGQITDVPYDPALGKVYSSWDLGINDPTVILFWQQTSNQNRLNLIDYYSANNRSIDHFVRIVMDKPYVYGGHYPPHDIAVREQSTGTTRREIYKRMGIDFKDPIQVDFEDGIEAVKCTLPKIWIDKKKCAFLVKTLENYRQKYNEKESRYYKDPVHDEYSHPADALRYMCLALPTIKEGMTASDADALYKKVNYGSQSMTTYNKPWW